MRRLLGIICLFRGHGVEEVFDYDYQHLLYHDVLPTYCRCPLCHARVHGGLRRFVGPKGAQ